MPNIADPDTSSASGLEGVESRRLAGYGEGIVQTANARSERRRKPTWQENRRLEREWGFKSHLPHQSLRVRPIRRGVENA